MTNRFVILHHTGYGHEHWDLMLEHGDVLWTWQLLEEPRDILSQQPIPAKRIGDHRKLYLEYEGPVSGNRGHIRRIDSGPLTWISIATGNLKFTAFGDRLRGRLELLETKVGWVLRAAGAEPSVTKQT